MVYPFATSRPIKPELAFDNFDMSSMPPNQHIFGWPVLNSLEFFFKVMLCRTGYEFMF